MALEKVLVVDDDPNICDVLRMYLENEGYSVILAYDGEEALVKFNALKPDIILLDVMLPTLDGWQVCREVRKKSSEAVPMSMVMEVAGVRISPLASMPSRNFSYVRVVGTMLSGSWGLMALQIVRSLFCAV